MKKLLKFLAIGFIAKKIYDYISLGKSLDFTIENVEIYFGGNKEIVVSIGVLNQSNSSASLNLINGSIFFDSGGKKNTVGIVHFDTPTIIKPLKKTIIKIPVIIDINILTALQLLAVKKKYIDFTGSVNIDGIPIMINSIQNVVS